MNESYDQLEGYNPDADLSLGCGIPTQYAGLKAGDHVLDLGSGAGNDCFVARAIVGESGHVTGIDFTEAMLLKAEENRKRLGYENIEFVRGDIENIPLPGDKFDVVLSNCVLNLVPDKEKVFKEIFRVLKTGGHFCISDVVVKGALSEKMQKDAEMYVGCVSGASEINDYLKIIRDTGFVNMVVHKQKKISLPESLLSNYYDENGLRLFQTGETGIFSITVSAAKPY
jgi:ubiquinone/menaquinone biosynthesis C-methylase UbiE